ncbi:MAG: 1,4-dihydroxy-2-naphthoate polyprenyltransferase [Gemmatimonadetes bacterium]|nr:1,4-dihydroxy-2-naphthoate polyprenyltransferase [Gemmatimonadota bacterium]
MVSSLGISAHDRGLRMSPWRVWALAARPRTLPAAAAPVAIGAGLAASRDGFAAGPALAALIGALLIQIATNLANDYYDYVRGGDTDDRVGPVRVTQAGLVSPGAVKRAMLTVLLAALAVGVYLVSVGGWPIVWIGLASLVCAVAYTGGPFPLAYHGLGDLFVFVFFGLVAVGGTVWVQTLTFTPEALWAGAGIGALSTAILVVNNLRDIPTDRIAGKNTLAVRLGVGGSRVEYVAMLLLGAAVPPVGVIVFGWPPAVWGASAVVLAAGGSLRRVLRFEAPHDLLPALGGTARVVALYGLVLGAALAWGP